MPDAPPPGSPAEARAILLAQLAAMKNLADALQAHTAALGVYIQRMEQLQATLEALTGGVGGVPPGGSFMAGLAESLGAMFGDDPPPPPPRRRRR